MPKPSSGKHSAGGLIPNDRSKKWKVELNFQKEWKHMQSLFSEEDKGEKAANYFYSLNRSDSPFGALKSRYQDRYQYVEHTYWEIRNEINKNFDNKKITEDIWKKQLTSLYTWKNNAEQKNSQIRDKERAIYEKLREAYHEKYKGYLL